MMYAPPLREMLFVHLFLGMSLCLWAAMYMRKHERKRKIFNFGDGLWGETNKWIQWFSWAMTFEIITSFLYFHSGLFYYEVAMSPFEAVTFVLGAFIMDRVFDIFMGDADVSLPKPKIDLSGINKGFRDITARTLESVKQSREESDAQAKATQEQLKQIHENLTKEKSDFDDLIKGH